MNNYDDKKLIFGLDIGTRTVIGSVGYMEEDKWIMLECVCKSHEERAMMDGQIHDIQKVARIVNEVKGELEEKLSIQLTEVAIAAAGRVLSTQVVNIEKQLEEIKEITKSDVQSLEVEGIVEAKRMLDKETAKVATDYFCVAHTVMNYYLDDYVIANLEGHKGERIGVSLLATFLPKGVIDSLYAVTERVGLEVKHLTLEPIAAINAVIPEHIRLLNLALVDIGAGTSDIAITKEGAVIAYGMIPMAGDEVTEAIVHRYLVDFNMAEEMKRQLQVEDVIDYTDIIGIENSVTKEDILACIEPAMTQLAKEISKTIQKLNGKKATNAVFCVGGGSQMPGLIEKVGDMLKLPTQRVAMRSTKHITQMVTRCEVADVPEMITPIGICMTAAREVGKDCVRVSVNGKTLSLLQTKKLKVLDALIEAGIDHTQIFPTNGKTLMFKLNGKRIRIKGEVGKPSQLLLNNQVASVENLIQEGDQIILIKAQKGKDGEEWLKNYIDSNECYNVYLENQLIKLPIVLVNGDVVDENYSIVNQDEIEIMMIHTLEELLSQCGIDRSHKVFSINKIKLDYQYRLRPGDCIESEVFLIQDEKDVLGNNLTEEIKNEELERVRVTVNEQTIQLNKQDTPYMFVHIFDYIDFDLSKPQGTVKMLLNHKPASVTDPLKEGDNLQIYWEN